MLQLKVLILELGAVNRLSTCSIASCEVSSLDHELLDHSVECRTLVREKLASFTFTLLAGAESAKVLGGLGDNIIVELEGHSAFAGLANADVEVDAAAFGGCCVGHVGWFGLCKA